MLSATSSMSIILGIFIQFLFGTFLNWRTVALINIIFPITAIICLFFIPESPHWLISKQRNEEAKKSLRWLRGWCSESEILDEYNEIFLSIYKNQPNTNKKLSQKSNIRNYLKRSFIEPYFLVCLAFFLGHFSGMTTLQTYAVEIFDTLRAPIDKYYATLILGIVELLGTLVCVIFVHYTGKRVITFTSTLGCALCFMVVGTYAYLIDSVNSDRHTWVPTTFLILSAFLSHIGIRLLPWILIGEVFPNETRANGSGLSGGAGYIFGFLANKLFFTMIGTLSWPGTFWWYGITGIIGTVILYFMLPETEGKPLGEIQLHFTGEKRLRKSVRRGKKKVNCDNGNKVGVIGMPVKEILESENVESRL